MQLGFEIYMETKFFTRSMSLSFPPVPTLAMRPNIRI